MSTCGRESANTTKSMSQQLPAPSATAQPRTRASLRPSLRDNTEAKGNASADQDAVKVTATGNYHGADEKATPYRKRVHSESSIKRGDGSNSEEEDDDASAASFSELFGAEGHQHLKHCFVKAIDARHELELGHVSFEWSKNGGYSFKAMPLDDNQDDN